jgi:hypothetical protein
MSPQDPPATRHRTFGWCSKVDVLAAMKIVGEEIRSKCHRHSAGGLTLGDACQLAQRIKEHRELIRQLADRRHGRHVRRCLRLNRALRNRLLAMAARAGLDSTVLIFK